MAKKTEAKKEEKTTTLTLTDDEANLLHDCLIETIEMNQENEDYSEEDGAEEETKILIKLANRIGKRG